MQETRECQNCKKDFEIAPEDFEFYKKIAVPAPTWCPECRLVRRLAFREERTLYKDICDLCGKDILSLYAPGNPFTVYCSSCWWGDTWDAGTYGQEYDFSKPFFLQFQELQKKVPRQATTSRNSLNCNYCHGIVDCADCYCMFGGFKTKDSMYCQAPMLSRNCVDADVVLNGDHAYATVNSTAVFNTRFVYFSKECLNCSFLFDCIGCSDCFGCINLRNKKYHIFNIPYSKKEYEKEMEKWDLQSFSVLQEAQKKFEALYASLPHRYAFIKNSVEVTGDDIENANNCKMCFSVKNGIENCKYIFLAGLLLKDSHDISFGGDMSQMVYEMSGVTQSQNTLFTKGANNAVDVKYSEQVYNPTHCFGCVNSRNKKYCILNKQYTKEEYEVLVPKVIQHMNDMPYSGRQGRVYTYGEAFPIEISPFAYNETWAHQWFPLSKEEARAQGYLWRDPVERHYNITLLPENIPDSLQEISDAITEEIIGCAHGRHDCNEQCSTAFRILPAELAFYRKMNVALPRLCPNCRYYQRLKKRNPLKLWHRQCMCSKDGHIHKGICTNEFETAYAPDRPEIIYCEKCFQQEFI